MHGREARSLSWVKIGTQVKILTLISAENFPAPNYAKIDPPARKLQNTDYRYILALSVLHHRWSWLLSRRGKKSVHSVHHPESLQSSMREGSCSQKGHLGRVVGLWGGGGGKDIGRLSPLFILLGCSVYTTTTQSDFDMVETEISAYARRMWRLLRYRVLFLDVNLICLVWCN